MYPASNVIDEILQYYAFDKLNVKTISIYTQIYIYI